MMSLVSKTQILMIIIQAVVLATAKPTEQTVAWMSQTQSQSQPVFEQQLTVWPTEVDDIVDALEEVPFSDVSYVTMVEEPIAVMPDMDYSQDDEEDDVGDNIDDTNEKWPIVEDEDEHQAEDIQVLENYHKSYGNGTEEHKLVLSSGMVNYQRIDYKLVKGKLRPVHDGYYTVPSDDVPATFSTIYYHADENGYNVYKTELSLRNPAHDFYLQYTKDQDAILEQNQ